jgi:hypothetical protein
MVRKVAASLFRLRLDPEVYVMFELVIEKKPRCNMYS